MLLAASSRLSSFSTGSSRFGISCSSHLAATPGVDALDALYTLYNNKKTRKLEATTAAAANLYAAAAAAVHGHK